MTMLCNILAGMCGMRSFQVRPALPEVIFILVVTTWATGEYVNKSDLLQPPQFVTVDGIGEKSFTLLWKPPPDTGDPDTKPLSYLLTVSRQPYPGAADDIELMLPPSSTSKSVTDLKTGTSYQVELFAVYRSFSKVPAPRLNITTLAVMSDIPAEAEEPECNCSENGMVACVRTIHSMECTCYPGYEGRWCEACSRGYFHVGKECRPCPCSNLTSTEECTVDTLGQVACKSCLPGHRGALCGSCAAGYHWKEDRCQPINCLSFSLCMEERDAPGCQDCAFLDANLRPPTAQRSMERTIADGTVPLIGVVVTLGIILLVAATATCYRYWTRRQTRPRLPFWSIELREEKMNLSSECQYQHLDAAASRVVQADSEAEANRETTQSSPKTYRTMDV